jgi:hypothetical protein
VRTPVHNRSFNSTFDISPHEIRHDTRSARDISYDRFSNNKMDPNFIVDDDAKFSDISCTEMQHGLNLNQDESYNDMMDRQM